MYANSPTHPLSLVVLIVETGEIVGKLAMGTLRCKRENERCSVLQVDEFTFDGDGETEISVNEDL